MKTAHAGKRAATDTDRAPASVRSRLTDYLQRLGVGSPQLLDALASHCLSRARKRSPAGSGEELLRRAIEEAQNRMDFGLARLLGLNPTRDAHTIAGARAALLMCRRRQSTDFVFTPDEPDPERLARLQAALPVATPPESPRPMMPQKLQFRFFKSS